MPLTEENQEVYHSNEAIVTPPTFSNPPSKINTGGSNANTTVQEIVIDQSG
jgi:hypothetical protein